MNEVWTSVVIVFSLLCLVLALAPAVPTFTSSESRPERDLRIRGSQEVKLSVSSERCKPPTVHRWQIIDKSEGHDPLVSCVDANGENLWTYRIRYYALSLFCHSTNNATYLFLVHRQENVRKNKEKGALFYIKRSSICVHKLRVLLRVCISVVSFQTSNQTWVPNFMSHFLSH
jgi:hypothetical protein